MNGKNRLLAISFLVLVLALVGCETSPEEGKKSQLSIFSVSPGPNSEIGLGDTLKICFSEKIYIDSPSLYGYDGPISMMYLDSNMYPGAYVNMQSRYSDVDNCASLTFLHTLGMTLPRELILSINSSGIYDKNRRKLDIGEFGDSLHSIGKLNYSLVE